MFYIIIYIQNNKISIISTEQCHYQLRTVTRVLYTSRTDGYIPAYCYRLVSCTSRLPHRKRPVNRNRYFQYLEIETETETETETSNI